MLEQRPFLHYIGYGVAKMKDASLTFVSVSSMPTSVTPKARQEFDYASLDGETYRFVKQQTGEIRALMKRTAQDIIEVGQRLLKVKEKLGHGSFLNWLEAEFDWHRDTANKFMHVAKQFGSVEMSKISTFDLSALYQLAAPSTPQSARNEALTRAKAGESITYTSAKAIKQKYATPQSAAPRPESPPQSELKPVLQPPLIPALSLQSGSKLEIVAIHRQAQPPALEADPTLTIPPPPVSEPDVPGIWWQLGGKHLLYCGDPNSPEFLGRVTEDVQLLLAFPPTRIWQPSMPSEVRLILSDYLPILHSPDRLDEFLESNVLFNSNLRDTVVIGFLPTPDILSILNRLDRKGAIAEPDAKRCNAVITDWKKAGLKVERLS